MKSESCGHTYRDLITVDPNLTEKSERGQEWRERWTWRVLLWRNPPAARRTGRLRRPCCPLPLPAGAIAGEGGLCVPTGESWTGDEEQGQSRGRAAGVGDRTSGGGLSADVEQREGKGGPQRSPGLSNVSYWAQKELTKLKKYIPSIFFEEVH